ncbi:potassium transporter Kup [Gemmatimonas groenlandica]|uniref:Probable potassium transport system protein Kup n=1 Tax=Gemmatimonas groenlandica TaxID=2732249 RepID=A0A6M4IY79_9BACT|nr:potassium transporter Kup [Gemmatimonas groenlandica]QJR37832.1 potassium transporter Kup [Gemmatimonas groenlandica]
MTHSTVSPSPAPSSHAPDSAGGRRLTLLTLAALGVVYGDIGTSPLYAMKEAFGPSHGLLPNAVNVYGILSLVTWSILLVVVAKYLVFILRADNNGEGGVLAMLALLLQDTSKRIGPRRRTVLVLLGVFGTALLYGDGIITPAISVLGAVEGLDIVTPTLSGYVVAITLVILVVLFAAQRFGTATVGRAFGPLTLVWFVVIGSLGLTSIIDTPQVLTALNPLYGLRFLLHHGTHGFVALGAVFLSVTGAEALYADMGHFGKVPIRRAFFAVVLPALLLNYFGQGALLLRDPAAVSNPFYLLAPSWFLIPLLIIATLAAIVASQALISGAFSLARQSIQLGYLPRMTIVQTSHEEYGQIYIPQINAALMLGTVCIVLGFKSSAALGAAYGIAVTGTMSITTLLFAVVARTRWNWPLWQVATFATFFFVLDFAFLGANVIKIAAGGWVPLVLAAALVLLMTTWKRGRLALQQLLQRAGLPLDLMLDELGRRPAPRVPGTAVFLTSDSKGAPVVLLHHLKHNKALHQQVVLLSVSSSNVPTVPREERVTVAPLDHGFWRVTARYGFMESPDVPAFLAQCAEQGIVARPMETSYYLGHERLLPTGSTPMAAWRKRLFVLMSRNAQSAAQFFQLPSNRVVEMGAQIEF